MVLELKKLDEILIFGNPLKFHQIIVNLIANAIDAYKNTYRQNPVVEISLAQENDRLVLVVKDYGSGISQSLLETIFDPFFTTKDIHHGTGLGLSTTKNIVEQDFSGAIQVISTEGVGSIFIVTIQLVQSP